MNEISCDVCMDLMPLVTDGVASEDSVQTVERHIATCEACKAVYSGSPPAPNPQKAFAQVKKQMRTVFLLLMVFGMIYGLSLTAGPGMLSNLILMPLLGALGYGVFRWRAVIALPVLLFITHLVTNFLGLGGEVLDFGSLFWMTFYYCLFAMVGIVIAGLLHFALRKEK